ncbi:MAG: hypothetical protein ACP5QU_02000, partial [Anaerolineae bacterium]
MANKSERDRVVFLSKFDDFPTILSEKTHSGRYKGGRCEFEILGKPAFMGYPGRLERRLHILVFDNPRQGFGLFDPVCYLIGARQFIDQILGLIDTDQFFVQVFRVALS